MQSYIVVIAMFYWGLFVSIESVTRLDRQLSGFKAQFKVQNIDGEGKPLVKTTMMDDAKLRKLLNYNLPVGAKRDILLAEIGSARIDLHSICLKKIEMLEEMKQFDAAVELMNDYASNFTIPFINNEKPASFFKKFVSTITNKPFDPKKYANDWADCYQQWKKNRVKLDQYPPDRYESFTKLKMIFEMTYALSFSNSNFPPRPLIITINQ